LKGSRSWTAPTRDTARRARVPRSRATCSSRHRGALGGVACLLVGLGVAREAGPALAAEKPRVVVIEDPAETTILPRLRAELEGLDLDVRTVARPADEELPRDLVESARQLGAVAAFRIIVEKDRADVWIADRLTGKVVLRELLPRGAQIDGRLVALRAVELLRASLLELELPRAVPQGELPPSPALTERTGLLPERERFSLAAGAAFLWSPGGCTPGWGVAASVGWRPTWIGVRLSGGSVLAPATLDRLEGRGDVTTRWLALEAFVQPRPARRSLRPRAGLGLAGLSTDLRGVAEFPHPTHEHTVYTLAPIASLDIGWAVHRRARLALGVAYLRPLRGVDILIAGQSAGTYGRDIVLANLGLDVVLP